MDPSADWQALPFHATGTNNVDDEAVLADLVTNLITTVAHTLGIVGRCFESAVPFLLQRLWSAEPQVTKRRLSIWDAYTLSAMNISLIARLHIPRNKS